MAEDISRFEDEVIPTSYASWRHCIEVKCGIALTAEYVEKRIRVLADPGQEETQRFARTYGPEHLKQVISWFRLARASATTPTPQRQAGRTHGAAQADTPTAGDPAPGTDTGSLFSKRDGAANP
jgi:hypothetical protein